MISPTPSLKKEESEKESKKRNCKSIRRSFELAGGWEQGNLGYPSS
jgi:hypothetical protein